VSTASRKAISNKTPSPAVVLAPSSSRRTPRAAVASDIKRDAVRRSSGREIPSILKATDSGTKGKVEHKVKFEKTPRGKEEEEVEEVPSSEIKADSKKVETTETKHSVAPSSGSSLFHKLVNWVVFSIIFGVLAHFTFETKITQQYALPGGYSPKISDVHYTALNLPLPVEGVKYSDSQIQSACDKAGSSSNAVAIAGDASSRGNIEKACKFLGARDNREQYDNTLNKELEKATMQAREKFIYVALGVGFVVGSYFS
jgi:hypothetical protein